MIVCICHRVSDSDIAHAVRQGTTGFDSLQRQTGVATGCGRCGDCARQVFDAARASGGACRGAVPITLATGRAAGMHAVGRRLSGIGVTGQTVASHAAAGPSAYRHAHPAALTA